jgi:hypothetical protein
MATGAELAMSILLGFVWLKRPQELPVAAPDPVSMSADPSSVFLPDDGTQQL